jgi:hypothetical protein
MKKVIVVVIVLIAFAGLISLSFAEGQPAAASQPAATAKAEKPKIEVVRGEITSIDAANGQMVIKEAKSGTEKTVLADSKMMSGLKVGQNVKVKLQPGTNKVESVHVQAKHKPETTK